MNFRVAVCVSALIALAGCSSSTGMYRWVPFMGNGKKGQPQLAKVNKNNPYGAITGPVHYGLEMRVFVIPAQVRLSDTRSLEVHLQLINRTKKSVNLVFNDSRKYDFILRDATGRKLAQWSDDQPVTQSPSYAIINPGERAEFVGNVSTRDMVAGRTYSLEAILVGYDRMQVVTQLVPTGQRVLPPAQPRKAGNQPAPAPSPTPTPSSLLQPLPSQ